MWLGGVEGSILLPALEPFAFDALRIAYAEQVRGLLDGGVDTLLIETIFDM